VTAIVGFKKAGAVAVNVLHAAGHVSRISAAPADPAFLLDFYVQIPVAIYQVIFVVPKRVAFRGEDEKWDSVVGTFGGDPMGGGNTAAMGMFCLLIMLLKCRNLSTASAR
jgi:hypothetical protein